MFKHRQRAASFLSFWVTLLLTAGVAMAQPSKGLRVAVVQSAESVGPKDSLKAVQAAVVQSLGESSIETVPAGLVPREAAACKGAGCATALGNTSDATHVLVVSAKYANEAFSMALEVWSTRTRSLVASEARDCAICDLKDFEQAAHTLAANLVPRIPNETKPASAPAPMMATEPATAHVDNASALTIARWVGIAAGTALIGTGIFYLMKDGDPSCRSGEVEPCDRVHDTKTGGLALIGVGAAVGVAAVVVPMFASSPDGTKVAGLAASGRF
jgi:hypothetical protein